MSWCVSTASTIWVSIRRTGFNVIMGSWKIIAMRLPRRRRHSRASRVERSRPFSRMLPPTMRPGASTSPMIE
jgi:hypothetical protein